MNAASPKEMKFFFGISHRQAKVIAGSVAKSPLHGPDDLPEIKHISAETRQRMLYFIDFSEKSTK